MSYTLVLEWMPGDLYMSAVTARCTAPTSSYSVVWLPPNKVYQITLYCGSTSLVSFLVGAFRGKAWSYMNILVTGAQGFVGKNLVANLWNIAQGKNRTRPNLHIEEIFAYDLDLSLIHI